MNPEDIERVKDILPTSLGSDEIPEADAAAGETAPEKATSPLSAPARPERLLD